jgi:hypothetical protein
MKPTQIKALSQYLDRFMTLQDLAGWLRISGSDGVTGCCFRGKAGQKTTKDGQIQTSTRLRSPIVPGAQQTSWSDRAQQ